MELASLIDRIESKDDFVQFMKEFYRDFLLNGQKWENDDLGAYLEAVTAVVNDSTDKSLHNIDFTPSWKLFAGILLGASAYE